MEDVTARPRPRRKSRDLTRDLVRETPNDVRIARTPGLRMVTLALGGFVVLALVGTLVVLPVRDLFRQRTAIAQRSAEFNALADANEKLQNEVDYLQTPQGIVSSARTALGYVFPGERRVTILDMPKLPTALPPSWPYSMVTNIVAVRSSAATQSSGQGSYQP